MPHAPRFVLCVTASLTLIAGCNNNDGATRAGSCDTLLPGDLVITEIMANPAGPDTGNEWFEIFNPTDADINIAGVALAYSKPDGSRIKTHAVDSLVVPAGDFVVVGGQINGDTLPEHMDYGYGRDLGDFGNANGRLALACGATVIDDALYDQPSDGISRGFTGDRTPDATAADDLNFWCDATTAHGDAEFATPGAPNDVCEGVGSTTECEDDGALRAVIPPAPGSLVITEVMPNPAAVDDKLGEWIEVYFSAAGDINGLEVVMGDKADVVLDGPCHHFEAGSYAVLARTATTNGGLPRVDGVFDVDLSNTDRTLEIRYGGELLDAISWGNSQSGKSLQLDPNFISPQANDAPEVFCPATTPYGDGDLGTPGVDNERCPIPAPDGECFEPDGSTRPIVSPAVGDLLITEFHANPAAVEDADGEWFEVRANGTFDLNGLQIRRDEDDEPGEIEGGDCIAMTPGRFAVVARDRDPGVNGGLEAVDAVFAQSIRNSAGRLALELDGEILDVITWSASQSGIATQLGGDLTDPADNDDEQAWCGATEIYGDGDLGTPGDENTACGGVTNGMCFDNDTERTIAAPVMGELVITEVMANPDAVSDSDGEWFELKNISGAAIDLNGLQMGFDDADASASLRGGGACITVAPDGYAVLAGNADMVSNGGLPAETIGMGYSSIGNTGRVLWIGYDQTPWDSLRYPDAAAGVASSVDPAAETTDGNDDETNICDANTPYGDGDLGSPGGPGPACGGGVGDGECLDGGIPRPIVSPVAGDLVINEWMPNPNVVADAQGEWFEVYVDADVDLNGLELSRGGADNWTLEETVDGDACITVDAGSFVLFARDPDPRANGGLPTVDVEFGFGLNNSNHGIAIGLDGTFLDEVSYTSSTAGAASQLDPGSLSPAGNDDPDNICAATAAYDDGDNSGTPGAANDGC